METKELIAIIDDAGRKLSELPKGYNYAAPEVLQELPAKQLLELANHYGVDPSLPYGTSNKVEVTVMTAKWTVVARSTSIKREDISPRSLLEMAAKEVAQ